MRARMSALNIQKYTCTVHRVEWVDRWQTRSEILAEDLLTFVQLEDSLGMPLDSSDKFERPFLEIDFFNKICKFNFSSIILQFTNLTLDYITSLLM